MAQNQWELAVRTWNGRCSVALMTRFRRVFELPPRRAVVLTEDEVVLDAAFAHCQRVAKFRRAAQAALGSYDLSFPMWRVLAVTDRLVRETVAEVSQRDVCLRADLGKSIVSYLMRGLRERHLIEREPDDWMADCILLSERGKRLLAASRGAVAQAARRVLDPTT